MTNDGQVAAVSPPTQGTVDQLVASGQARRARRPRADLATITPRESTVTSSDLIADLRGRW